MKPKKLTLGNYVIAPTPVRIPAQVWRVEMLKIGNLKPYVLSYSPTLYSDSVVPGISCDCPRWIIKRGSTRSCRHVRMVAELYGFRMKAA